MSRRILLLGADGFLGRHIGRVLDEGIPRGDEPGERLTVIRHSRASLGSTGDERLVLDLRTSTLGNLADLVDRAAPSIVVNAVGATVGPVAAMVVLNSELPALLADVCASRHPGIRLVHIASSAEYGRVPFGTSVAEGAPTNPVSDYGRTKLAGTLAVLAHPLADLDARVLRVFNPVGAGSSPHSLLGRAAQTIRAALSTGSGRVSFGPLDAYRDFLDVQDVADAVGLAAVSPGDEERLLNVGSGRAVQAREAVRQLAALAGFRGVIDEAAAPPDRSAEIDWQQADLSRTRRILGWEPRRSLADALQMLWTG